MTKMRPMSVRTDTINYLEDIQFTHLALLQVDEKLTLTDQLLHIVNSTTYHLMQICGIDGKTGPDMNNEEQLASHQHKC